MRIIILGRGAYARCCLGIARRLDDIYRSCRRPGLTLVGTADRVAAAWDRLGDAAAPTCPEIDELAHLGNDDQVMKAYTPAGPLFINGVGSNGAPERRAEVFERYCDRGYRFTELVHPLATLPRGMRVGVGAHLHAGAFVGEGATIEADALINVGAVIDHDAVVGRHTHIAPGAVLCGGAQVGKISFIGVNATVLPGVRVGDRAVVGAGAVVTRDVPGGWTVVGVPARRTMARPA